MAILDRPVYATQPRPLENQIASYLKTANPAPIEGDLFAIVVPDTNLLSGGEVAAEVYKLLQDREYDTVILIASSHTGSFPRMHICSVDTYHTPLGNLMVNDRMRHELCDEDDDIYVDDSGHFHTEGVDVQLPYLHQLLSDFDIVPIVMGDESPEYCRELGHAIGEVMYNRRTLIVASTDVLNASEENLATFKSLFEAHDVSRLMALVNSEQVHLHGKGPLLVAMIAALHRHANKARILRMEQANGTHPGYLGAVLWRE